MNTVMLCTIFRSIKLVYFPENCALIFRKFFLEVIYKNI